MVGQTYHFLQQATCEDETCRVRYGIRINVIYKDIKVQRNF